MTTSDILLDSTHDYLLRCVQTVAEDCPVLSSSSPDLHRLRNLVMVLQSTSSSPAGPPKRELTLEHAWALVSDAQSSLNSLRVAGTANPVTGELDQALSETLEGLSARIGQEMRILQAERVRGLYVIIDPTVTGGRDPMEIANASVRGGAKMLQLRDKLRDKGQQLPLAQALKELCLANDVMLIINDHVDLAAAIDSDGVHVGQTDLPVAEARSVLAPHQVLGRSNRDIHLIIESQEMGADHVAFGAIYTTTTKVAPAGGRRGPQGIEPLIRAREAAKVPLVAIGGINAGNVTPVVEAGADAICVTAAVASAPEPEAAAQQMVELIRQAGGKV
jgi:thiamine-phosphate pyrophosphorylase